MSQNAFAEVQSIIEKVGKKDVSSTTEETKIEDLPIDSLDLFTVIGDLEDATGRSMEDDEIQAMNTVGDLVRHFYA